MLCLPLTREVDFCEAKRRRERKRKTTPQSAAADSLRLRCPKLKFRPRHLLTCSLCLAPRAVAVATPDKGSRQRLTTHLWVAGNRCVAGRPIGLCPKMKYPPLYGGIFILCPPLFHNCQFIIYFLKCLYYTKINETGI